MGGKGTLGIRSLFLSWWTNVGQIPWVSSANLLEVLASDRKRQVPIWPAPHYVGIMVPLTIILPEADRTNLENRRFTERAIATAGTRAKAWVRRSHRRSLALLANVRNGSKADISNGAAPALTAAA